MAMVIFISQTVSKVPAYVLTSDGYRVNASLNVRDYSPSFRR